MKLPLIMFTLVGVIRPGNFVTGSDQIARNIWRENNVMKVRGGG